MVLKVGIDANMQYFLVFISISSPGLVYTFNLSIFNFIISFICFICGSYLEISSEITVYKFIVLYPSKQLHMYEV